MQHLNNTISNLLYLMLRNENYRIRNNDIHSIFNYYFLPVMSQLKYDSANFNFNEIDLNNILNVFPLDENLRRLYIIYLVVILSICVKFYIKTIFTNFEISQMRYTNIVFQCSEFLLRYIDYYVSLSGFDNLYNYVNNTIVEFSSIYGDYHTLNHRMIVEAVEILNEIL